MNFFDSMNTIDCWNNNCIDFNALFNEAMDNHHLRYNSPSPIPPRRRRVGDVIDCMGSTAASPATPYSAVSSSLHPSDLASPSAASSTGFLTPQRQYNLRSCSTWPHLTTSPDLGYSTPENRKSYAPDWAFKNRDTHDAFGFVDEDNYAFQQDEAMGQMAAHKDADRYNMEHMYRGRCVIFNHEHFDTGFAARDGSSADARRIEQTFQRLGFSVDICDDYEHSGIISKISELAAEDHTNNDCICIFVLTHGLKNDLICAKNVVYKIDDLWKPFTADKCKSLAGKPKLFFFQACRGDDIDAGIKLHSNMSMHSRSPSETDSTTASYKIPTHADFLFAHSTVQGFFSWRNPEEGTWYIQSLCEIIDTYSATTDLAKMLTMVARKVATDYASFNNIDPTMHDKKQVPSVTSMLIRDLYFTSKHY
ncbi:hypothetical protein TKK_0006986 [Trichogramma kaykai]|uniref:Caspase n=1 Tax=Trichogramma kaykai TaxID=54128 RepID=A0ABD2XB33_9HYME